MITYRRMIDCTLNETVEAWNKGFEGYFVNVQMNVSQFLKRLITEDLCPNRSFVAFDGQKPVGLILNGFRNQYEKHLAWNGGTAVRQEYRGKNIGSELVEQSIAMYKEENVDFASLEAIIANEPAIKTYKKFGYRKTDLLQFQQHKGNCSYLQQLDINSAYSFTEKPAVMATNLSYYNPNTAWQTQENSIKDGRVLEVIDNGRSAAYLLYKENYSNDGQLQSIIIYQSEVNEGNDRHQNDVDALKEQVLKHLFNKVNENVSIMTFNLSSKNKLITTLKKCNFQLQLEQVHMKLNLN